MPEDKLRGLVLTMKAKEKEIAAVQKEINDIRKPIMKEARSKAADLYERKKEIDGEIKEVELPFKEEADEKTAEECEELETLREDLREAKRALYDAVK